MIKLFVSSNNGQFQLSEKNDFEFSYNKNRPDENTIIIDPYVEHQQIFGFGGTLMDTDVYNLLRMSIEKQNEVLLTLFDKNDGAGWNFMRIPFGSSDWERNTEYYTYDDVGRGETDWELKYFTIQKDIERGLPDLLHRIKKINPDVMFMASVWAVPAWMKENDSLIYGRFNPKCTDVYAKYICKSVLAWQQQGIDLYAITTQNEVLTGDDRATPACRFTWRLQAPVLKALKREFLVNDIKTKIWCYDHNFDTAYDFVAPLLSNSEYYNVIDGVAMHDYSGSAKVMGKLQQMFPDMPFYMTERQVSTPAEFDRIVQQFHNGSRSYIQWVTITDEYGGPHQFLGKPFIYSKNKPSNLRSQIIVNLHEKNIWEKGSGWAQFAQFTKFINRGMVRIDSTYGHPKWITSAAFQSKNGDVVAVVVNQTNETQEYRLRIGESEIKANLNAQAVATYLFDRETFADNQRLPVSSAPEKQFIEEPAFDLELIDILLEEPVKAGEEAYFQAVIRNVGNAPTPKEGQLFVYFHLDGDYPIGRSVQNPPVIHPGCELVASVNFPFGLKVSWTAEAGYHLIAANVVLGNTFAEINLDNNRKTKEFYFPTTY